MTIEQALEQLNLGPGINEDVSEEYNEATDIAIEALEFIAQSVKSDVDMVKVADAIKALDHQPKWIPVTEALPKEGATVIASGKYNVYPEARFAKEYGWEWAYEAGTGYWTSIIEPVKAWMPLPGIYKEESEG